VISCPRSLTAEMAAGATAFRMLCSSLAWRCASPQNAVDTCAATQHSALPIARQQRHAQCPGRSLTPYDGLAMYIWDQLIVSSITTGSRLYIPNSGLAKPLLETIVSSTSAVRMPGRVLVTSEVPSVTEALWERITDGEMSGGGWGQVEVRLLDRGQAFQTGGRKFTHIFMHSSAEAEDIQAGTGKMRQMLEPGGVLVVTSWRRNWAPLLEEALQTLGRQGPSSVRCVPILSPQQCLTSASPTPTPLFGHVEDFTECCWHGTVELEQWSTNEVLSWMEDEQDRNTLGWSLVEKARLEQALRIAIMRRSTSRQPMELSAHISVTRQPLGAAG
jgi:hypothetical protein